MQSPSQICIKATRLLSQRAVRNILLSSLRGAQHVVLLGRPDPTLLGTFLFIASKTDDSSSFLSWCLLLLLFKILYELNYHKAHLQNIYREPAWPATRSCLSTQALLSNLFGPSKLKTPRGVADSNFRGGRTISGRTRL